MRMKRTAASQALAMLFLACAATAGPPSLADEPTLKGFMDRVKDYVALRTRVAESLPPLKQTDTPVQIVARERALGEAIEQARAGAREGEVFGSAAPFFAKELRDDWRSRSKTERAGLLRELSPGYRPKVNTVYPPTMPLATFPPALLERLPQLPDGLEYRIVGAHLILRDTKANLIVDVLPNALTGDGDDRRSP